MLAEIKGKISSNGSNLTERLEDNLTGNVFGLLRYIPFSLALRPILEKAIIPKAVRYNIDDIKDEFWADKVSFWPYDREGEIDALMEFKDVVIGIEIKYRSGLSSDDEIDNISEIKEHIEFNQSINQLARESRIVSRRGKNKKKLLLFIADRYTSREVYDDVIGRGIIEKGVDLGYLSWQDILHQLKKLRLADPFHKVIIQDIIDLLTRKGFEDFTNMNIEFDGTIIKSDFYEFEICNRVNWRFETTLTISEGDYYEFN